MEIYSKVGTWGWGSVTLMSAGVLKVSLCSTTATVFELRKCIAACASRDAAWSLLSVIVLVREALTEGMQLMA
jgi:hypothetical protein